MDGSGSKNAKRYKWIPDTGNPSRVYLPDMKSNSIQFTPTRSGLYKFTLKVNDSLEDSVNVTVTSPDKVGTKIAEETVAPEGGTIWIDIAKVVGLGNASLSIPAGALAGATVVSIRPSDR